MNEKKETLQFWGIVSLMGHQQVAGEISEQNIAGTNLLRIDIPETTRHPAMTKYYGSAAIYSIEPTTEETARMMAESLNKAVVMPYDIQRSVEKRFLLLKQGETENQEATREYERDEQEQDDDDYR